MDIREAYFIKEGQYYFKKYNGGFDKVLNFDMNLLRRVEVDPMSGFLARAEHPTGELK